MSSGAGIVTLENAIQSPAVDFSNGIPYDQLQGKTVLVTGGASGLGAAISRQAAQHGANVVVGDINEDLGTETVANLRLLSKSQHHHFVRVDVSDWDSQVALFKAAKDLSPHGGIDCVIANAGISDSTESEAFELNVPRFSTMTAPPPPRMRTLRVDLDGVLYTSTLALSYLSENPGSQKCSLKASHKDRDRHLLLVASIAGTSAFPAASIYSAAKHGVVGAFRALRISAPILHGVRVNLMCPQYVETPILGARGAGVLIGMPKTEIEDVAEAATRLIADQHIIGRALLIGTRGTPEQIEAAGLGAVPGRHAKGAVWDLHGHDLEQTDLLMRRTTAMLNLASKARGWSELLKDWWQFALALMAGLWYSVVGPRAGTRR